MIENSEKSEKNISNQLDNFKDIARQSQERSDELEKKNYQL
jgi:hypothetical protein